MFVHVTLMQYYTHTCDYCLNEKLIIIHRTLFIIALYPMYKQHQYFYIHSGLILLHILTVHAVQWISLFS